MNINTKLKNFKQNIEDIADKDYKEIDTQVEEEISTLVQQEVSEYEQKKQITYEKYIQKIEKEFNKKIYNYEIKCKKEIIEEEKNIRKAIKEECLQILKDYTEKDEYKSFILNNIKEAIPKIQEKNEIDIYLTKRDILKYGEEIAKIDNFNIAEMPDSNIGGCIVADENQGIFIDNTLLNILNEIKIQDNY